MTTDRAELTTAEAAAALNVSERRVRQMADSLGAHLVGPRKLMFPREAVEKKAAEAHAPRGPESHADLLRQILGEVQEIRRILEER